ncbi:MAG: protease HtpX [Spirochaetales bacterium]|nr:protease HtpX [Spirochaetales bacterium]
MKRIFLFLLVNFLVVLTVSLLTSVLSAAFGIQLGSGMVSLAIFCGIFGMSGAFISLAISRWMAKRLYGIQLIEAGERDPRLQSLYQTVSRLATQARIPVPEVGIYESPEPNAFATGPSRSSSLVAFSSGLLNQMDQRQVEAVAAHEVSHIANGDMVTMTLLTGVANALVMFLARIVAGAIDTFLRGDDEDEGGLGFFAHIVVVMVLESILMMLAYIPIAYFSRQREYRADAGAAKLTSAQSMASALTRLGQLVTGAEPRDSLAVAKISSGRRLSLWATHPSIEERVARLQSFRG